MLANGISSIHIGKLKRGIDISSSDMLQLISTGDITS
jgi:hypothetical protein